MASRIVKVGNVIIPPHITFIGDKKKIPVCKIQKFKVEGEPLTTIQLQNILNAKFPPHKREPNYYFRVLTKYSKIGMRTSPSVKQEEEIRLWVNQEYDECGDEGTISEFEIQYIKRS